MMLEPQVLITLADTWEGFSECEDLATMGFGSRAPVFGATHDSLKRPVHSTRSNAAVFDCVVVSK